MTLDIYCPKCDSTDVTIQMTDKLPEPERVSMDDLPKTDCITQLVHHIHNYKATCNNCGHIKKWTE